jgi:hypothetical protein
LLGFSPLDVRPVAALALSTEAPDGYPTPDTLAPLCTLPLDTLVDATLYVAVEPVLVVVDLPAVTVPPPFVPVTALAVAVDLPPMAVAPPIPVLAPLVVVVDVPAITWSPTAVVAPLEIAVVFPGTIQVLAVPVAPLVVAVVLPALTVAPIAPPVVDRPFTLLGQIDFFSPSPLTVYVSDHYIGPEVTGVEWLPLVAAWGPVEELVSAGAPVTSEVTFFNTKPIAGKARLSDVLRTPLNAGAGTYEFAGARVSLYRLDVGQPGKLLNVLYIEEPTEIDDRLFRLRMSDQGLLLEDRRIVTTIDRTAFPAAAPAVVNRTIPRAFGSLKNVPCIPVVDGVVGRLASAIDASVTTVPLVDATVFPSSGTVQINVEQITYTGKSGNSLTGCARARNGTAAAAHDAQSTVMEVRGPGNAYRFVAAENVSGFPHKAMANVRVNGHPAKTAPTLTPNATDVVAGKSFAAITFSVADVRAFHTIPVSRALLQPTSLPSMNRSFQWNGNQAIEHTLTVVIPSQGAEFASGPIRRRVSFTYQIVSGQFGVGDASVNPAQSQIWRTDPATGATVVLASGTKDANGYLIMPAAVTAEYDTGASVANETFTLHLYGDPGVSGAPDTPYVVLWTITAYTITGDVTAGGGSGGESTAAIVIGDVTCDLDGMQDDAAGTVSGTANALLENPVDVARFILTQLYGVAVADLAARWASSRATLAALAYKWAFLLGIEGATGLSDIRTRMAQQARAEIFIEAGKWDFVVIPSAPVADQVLDYARDVWDQRPAMAARTPRPQVFTAIRGQALLNYATRDYDYTAVAQVAGLATYTEDVLSFDFVQDRATADALAAFWLAQWQRQRWEIDLVAWENVMPLRKADHVAIDNHPVLTAHGDTALVFRILERSYLSGDPNPARVRLRAREGNA